MLLGMLRRSETLDTQHPLTSNTLLTAVLALQGDVACCDGCRAVYHLSCIGLEQLPEDDWFCPLCHCRECKEACRGEEDPLFINTKLVPVIPKQLQVPITKPVA